MPIQFPNESEEYRSARNALAGAEIELRRAMERVAQARRELPPGGLVPEDYVFQGLREDGSKGDVRLSELFAPGHRSLVIYNMMFPRSRDDQRPGPDGGSSARLPLGEGPCPSCTALLDQLDAAARHFTERVSFAVVAKTSLRRLLAFGKERGWRHVRLLSSAGNSYNRDYLGETADGSQMPMLNVFQRENGVIRHFWGAELLYAPMDPGQDTRHVGTIEPLWNMLDLTPEGRGSGWDEQLQYPCCASGSAG